MTKAVFSSQLTSKQVNVTLTLLEITFAIFPEPPKLCGDLIQKQSQGKVSNSRQYQYDLVEKWAREA